MDSCVAESASNVIVRIIPNLLGAVVLLFATFFVLICFEVIGPFPDPAVDGPIALALWGIGAAFAISYFFMKGRSLTLTVSSLAANVLLLLAAFGPARSDIAQQFRLALTAARTAERDEP
jgi:hypothetical protein